MNTNLEQELLAVQTTRTPNNAFVRKTMQAVRQQSAQQTFEAVLRTSRKSQKTSLFTRFRRLPAMVAIMVALISVLCAGGAVYAAVRYLPDLIKITGQSQTIRGTTEYTIPGFAACTTTDPQKTQRFEVAKDASSLSKNDVQRIIQARCESDLLDNFARQAWPTYGTHKVWKNGDTIYYSRVDTLGTIQSISASGATVSSDGLGGGLVTYKAIPDQKITAYAKGSQVSLGSLKKGDTVHIITRVAETYTTPTAVYQQGSVKMYGKPAQSQPRVVGIIGVIKLSEPLKYYGALQNDITEIPFCMGNAGEYCPSTSSIDVFPRVGGEGAQNPDLVQSPTNTYREISGVVTTLQTSSLTLKSSLGKTFTVTAPGSAFADYNTNYAPSYGTAGMLHVGSTISVLYAQPKTGKAQVITPSQIMTIRLLTDITTDKGATKPY